MKNKKLLFGFFAAIVLGSTFALASFVGFHKFIPIQTSILQPLAPANQSILDNTLINSTFLGPTNLGGRVRTLLIDKSDANHVYAGSCGGGIWETTTGGTSWKNVTGFNQNLIITSITQASNGDIYVGTGEGFIPSNGDMVGSKGFLGNGIYKRANGETDFIQLPSTIPDTLNCPNSEWAYVNDIAYDNTTNKLYAATNRGVRVSNDNGISWTSPISTIGNSTQICIVGNTIATNVANYCFISSDGGTSFTNQSTGTTGKLPFFGIGSMSLAIAPSNNNYIYVSIANTSGSFNNVFRSIDAGNSWTIIGPGGADQFDPLSRNGLYNNTIAVFPSNENKILVGGGNLWKFENANWTQISISNSNKTDPQFLPSSQHRIVFNPTNDNIFYVGSDGGVSKTIDGGLNFRLTYIGIASAPFYSITPGVGDIILGGSNGSGVVGIFPSGFSSPQNVYGFPLYNNEFSSKYAANIQSSFLNTRIVFASSINGEKIYRSPDYNFGWVSFVGADKTSTNGLKYNSFMPFSYWESNNDQFTFDTIAFINSRKTFNLKNGDGINKVYKEEIITDQTTAKIVPGSIVITTDLQKVVDDGFGRLKNQTAAGDDLGSIDYNTKVVDFSFLTAPKNGKFVELKYNVRYNAGDIIKVKSYIDNYLFNYTLASNLEPLDSIYPKDVVQSKLFLAASNSVWMTRKALDLTKPQPRWFKLTKTNISSDTICTISNSNDGDCIFYGTLKGKLFRINGIRYAKDCDTIIAAGDTIYPLYRSDLTSALNQANRKITSIAIDPNGADHIIVTLGGYNKTTYIYESTNALSASPIFTQKQGNLPPMPIYSAIIEMGHPNIVIIGTDNGLYSTDDINSSSPNWVDQSITGIPHVPVFMVKQQISNLPYTSYVVLGDTNLNTHVRKDILVNTTGNIFIATFGRGLYVNNTFKYANDTIDTPISATNLVTVKPTNVNIYPNPATNQTAVYFNVGEKSNAEVIVFDIQGRLVKKLDFSNIEGEQKVNIDCNNLKNGTYYVQILVGDKKMTGKFVVVK